ncbi:MAG: PAS domain S-box protein, partial [Deltaproteobacteria bacterium]|nr:PAS domain S-box protein [Kofleriaceae bacterium]
MRHDETMRRALRLGLPGGAPATTEALARGPEPDASGFDVVVIGADAAEPVRLAQHAQAFDRDLGVVIVTAPDDHARVAGAVSFAPFLTGVVRCVPSDPPAELDAAIDEAAAQTIRRRSFRATLVRAREQLDASPPPPPADPYVQHVLEHVPIAILAVDPGGHIVASNRAAQELLGRAERDLLGRDLGEGLCAAEREELGGAITAALAGAATRAPLSLAMVQGGRSLQLEGSVSALPHRQHPRAVVMLHDVSEQRALLAQLRTADRLATVGLLAAGVAHEVNNPLTAVLVNVDRAVKALESPAASSDPLARSLRTPLRDALEAADRIQAIVRDLMLLARGDDDAVRPIDVEPVLQSTVRMAGSQIRHRAQLVEQYARVPFARGNSARLGQVVLNLVLNAVQAIAERGAAHGELRIATSADDTHVHVDVEDDGPGMSPEVLERLFTPFFTTKAPGQGTGLGLSICHRIVTSMGGTIAVDSQLGRGTRVRVSLVRAVAAAPAVVPA